MSRSWIGKNSSVETPEICVHPAGGHSVAGQAVGPDPVEEDSSVTDRVFRRVPKRLFAVLLRRCTAGTGASAARMLRHDPEQVPVKNPAGSPEEMMTTDLLRQEKNDSASQAVPVNGRVACKPGFAERGGSAVIWEQPCSPETGTLQPGLDIHPASLRK